MFLCTLQAPTHYHIGGCPTQVLKRIEMAVRKANTVGKHSVRENHQALREWGYEKAEHLQARGPLGRMPLCFS